MLKKEFDCCGSTDEQPDDQDFDGCIPQDLEMRVTPNGTRLLAVDRERMYRTGDGSLWLSRLDYKAWSLKQGLEVDPIIWFTRMGHPLPPDVNV
jgi:hypothetical protein